MTAEHGFGPEFDSDSELLILGSFPSVKSRAVNFYYGNKQNRFWRTVCSAFGEEIPDSVEGKKDFLHRNKIALWDIVVSCEIEGSSDSTIKNYTVADLNVILSKADIRLILLNGSACAEIFKKNNADIGVPYKKMTSTSPANPRFNEREWREILDDFRRT